MKKFLFVSGILLAFLPFTLKSQTEIITPHGYRFINHTHKGGKKPQIGESVSAHVDVRVGKTLLSSSRTTGSGLYQYEIPDTSAGRHVPPVVEAALLMGVGDSATIYQKIDDYMAQFIPEQEKGQKEIYFQIVLTGIQGVEEKQRQAQIAREQAMQLRKKVEATVLEYTLGHLNNRVKVLPSGLKMLVEVAGEGPKIAEQEPIQVHYFGYLTDGTGFDNTFERREPLAFPAGVGQMIPGFDEGVMQLKHGSRAYLFIPPALGYGETGSNGIPPNSELIFYIEIL